MIPPREASLGRFVHPLGPAGDNGFQHDGGEIIFNLPNGLQGYLLINAKGERIDQGPTAIVTDKESVKKNLAPDVVNGISCMRCHARGMIEKADEIREHVLKNRKAFGDAADRIQALYKSREELDEFLHQDVARFRRAVNRAMGKPEGQWEDPLPKTEPIAALAVQFEQALDLKLAAAEVGMRPEEFLKGLERFEDLARTLGALKVEGGTIKRDVFVDSFLDLAGALTVPTDKAVTPPVVPPGTFSGHIFSPDGKRVVIRDGGHWSRWMVLDVTTGKELITFKAGDKTLSFRDMAFSPDGKRIAGASMDKGREQQVVVFDAQTGQELATFASPYLYNRGLLPPF
jgi:hypothetical protein